MIEVSKMLHRTAVALAVLLLACAPANANEPLRPRYGVKELPFVPTSINDDGMIVGYSTEDFSIWQYSVYGVDSEPTLVPGITAGDSSQAASGLGLQCKPRINNAGQILGLSPDRTTAVLVSEDGTASALLPLAGYTFSRFAALNDAGVVIGYSTNTYGEAPLSSGAYSQTIWNPGSQGHVAQDISSASSCDGDWMFVLGALSNEQEYLIRCQSSSGSEVPRIVSPEGFADLRAPVTIDQALLNPEDVNESGVSAGWLTGLSEHLGAPMSVTWPSLWSRTGFPSLLPLPSGSTTATAYRINDKQECVGSAMFTVTSCMPGLPGCIEVETAFWLPCFWSERGVETLVSLLDDPDGAAVSPQAADGLNNSGLIIGTGSNPGGETVGYVFGPGVRVEWEDGKPIKGATVEAYALMPLDGSSSSIVAEAFSPPNLESVTDESGFAFLPLGLDPDRFPSGSQEIGLGRGVRASIRYVEDSGLGAYNREHCITNYPLWMPTLPEFRQGIGSEAIRFPFPAIFQPGFLGQYNLGEMVVAESTAQGSADGLRAFLTADPGVLATKQGGGGEVGIPAFPFFGMPSMSLPGSLGNDGVLWGYDNLPAFSRQIAINARRLQNNLLQARVLPLLQQFTPDFQTINLLGHSYGGVITRKWIHNAYPNVKLNKYISFDGAHGGSNLPSLLYPWFRCLDPLTMNGYTIGPISVRGWNHYNSLPANPDYLLLSAWDDFVISPSRSAYGIGTRWHFYSGLFEVHTSSCLRSIDGWKLPFYGTGHSLQNSEEVALTAARFLAGRGSGSAQFSGSPQCEPGVAGSPPVSPGTGQLLPLSPIGNGTPETLLLHPGIETLGRVTLHVEGSVTVQAYSTAGEIPITDFESWEIVSGHEKIEFQIPIPPEGATLQIVANGDAAQVGGQVEYGGELVLDATLPTEPSAPGEPISVTATLKDATGAVVNGVATVAKATIHKPDGTESTVTLLDDGQSGDGAAGDGTYGGSILETTTFGRCHVIFTLTTLIGGEECRRDCVLPVAIDPGGAVISGTPVEYSVDEDLDGLIDAIELEVPISVEVAGDYTIQSLVKTASGDEITAVHTAFTAVNVPVVELVRLRVKGEVMAAAGISGSLWFDEIELVHGEESIPIAVGAPHSTVAHGAADYESPQPPGITHVLPNSGCTGGGETLVLYGAGLEAATAVTLNGVPVQDFSVASSTSLLVVTPPGIPGFATIEVITPWGATAIEGAYQYAGIPEIPGPIRVDVDCVLSTATLQTRVVTGTSGCPVSYFWMRNGVPIPDSGTARLEISGSVDALIGLYEFVVSNNVGSETVEVELTDCDGDGQLDRCQISSDSTLDCDRNEVLDSCEIGTPGHSDCNANGILDSCEIDGDFSLDQDANGVLDECSGFQRADCNQDGVGDISDVLTVIDHVFFGAGNVFCQSACDFNDDGTLDISDPIAQLMYLFEGGMAPPPPMGSCGEDPTPDSLSCTSYVVCP